MARVAVVTGGTRGIGHAISIALKSKGYRVAASYAGNDAAAQKFQADTGIPVYKFDVADFDACAASMAQIEKAVGPVDVLVNNAGITADGMFHKMTREQWDKVIGTNLTGLFNVTRQVWEGMRARKFGRVINISSINGQKGQMGQVNYSASKAGDIGFTKALARKALAPASPSTSSAPATSPRKWSRPCRRTCLRRHPADDPRRPPRRALGNRPLRRVPRLRRCRLHHRLDDHRQRRPVPGELILITRHDCRGRAHRPAFCVFDLAFGVGRSGSADDEKRAFEVLGQQRFLADGTAMPS